MSSRVSDILYIYSDLHQVACLDGSLVELSNPLSYQRLVPRYREVVQDIEAYARASTAEVVIVEVPRFRLGRRYLRLLKSLQAKRVTTYIYWTGEEALEKISGWRLSRLRLQWFRQFLGRRIAFGARPVNVDLTAVLPEPETHPNADAADPSELDTILDHFNDAIGDLAQNIEGVHQTRLSGEYFSNRSKQLEADLGTALERVKTVVTNAENAIDDTELVERQNDLRQVRDGVGNLAESLQVIEKILRNHRDYLKNGVEIMKSFDKRIRTGGLAGSAAVTLHAIPKILQKLENARKTARPAVLQGTALDKADRTRVAGTGMYFRLDYWAPMISGGSFGHTAYVVKELAEVSDNFICVTANRLSLIDNMGISQVVVDSPTRSSGDLDILSTAQYFETVLRPTIDAVRPAFIYERLSLGNTAGATLSREFGIPYVVEYNGSEISLKRSFAGTGYEQEETFLAAEALAFEQATLITVVSEHIKADLLERGIPEEKILVNPNCVDIDAYRPCDPSTKEALRKELGIPKGKTVVGFIGSFGGWHGIDILSESLRPILKQSPDVHFLLIGDGNFRHLIENQIAEHGLADSVTMTGRVMQAEGARLLQACDIFVSPHSSHMVDRKFFGSPTKLFEYMAMGGGVIASDLEQIGDVMRPALTAEQLKDPDLRISNERGVLCEAGDLDCFVDAVVWMVKNPEPRKFLGANARSAAEQFYTWELHVENFFRHMNDQDLVGYARDFSEK